MGLRTTYYLASDRSKKYTLTDMDILWLARSLWGEGGNPIGRREASAVAWCMMNRFLMWPKGRWRTFTEFMRAFSQPINPLWTDPTSSKCIAHPEACTSDRIARRRRIQGAAWDDLPFSAKLYATGFAQGNLFQVLPDDVVDFAACKVVRNQGKVGIDVGGNCFLRKHETDMNWLKGPVLHRVEPGATPVPGTYPGPEIPTWGYGAIFAWLTLTGWAVLRLFKK